MGFMMKAKAMYCDFTKEELDLLAHGFGFFVQEYNFAVEDNDPSHVLLEKLFRLAKEAEKSDGLASAE